MRHRIMTCKNHPNLRWSAKSEAVGGDKPGEPAHYNGFRHIFFNGTPSGKGMFQDGSGLDCTYLGPNKELIGECACPVADLIIAPEDVLVKI